MESFDQFISFMGIMVVAAIIAAVIVIDESQK